MGLTWVRFKSHHCSFETGLDDFLVGTLPHSGTNRPAVASELRVLHQGLSFAQVIQVFTDPFLLGKIAFETTSQTQQRSRTPMFEDM